MEDRGAYLIIGSTDEGSSFEYTQEQAQKVEARLIPLLQAEDSPYSRFYNDVFQDLEIQLIHITVL